MISQVGGCPVGESIDDLAAYAIAQGAEGYDVHEVRLCRCAVCGGQVFSVHRDRLEERAVQRICRGCGAEHFIADGEHWDGMKPAVMVCECDGGGNSELFNVAVGYSLNADNVGIRALAITGRCVACGRLGYWVDWVVRTSDMELLDLA